MSPQSPSVFFIGLYCSFVFSTACSLALASPSMSCHISACCLNQIYIQGVGVMSYCLGLLFHLTAASLWICVLSCCELRRLKGKRWLGKHARSSSCSPTAAPAHLCLLPGWCLHAPADSLFPAPFTRLFNCIKDRFASPQARRNQQDSRLTHHQRVHLVDLRLAGSQQQSLDENGLFSTPAWLPLDFTRCRRALVCPVDVHRRGAHTSTCSGLAGQQDFSAAGRGSVRASPRHLNEQPLWQPCGQPHPGKSRKVLDGSCWWQPGLSRKE